MKPSNIEHSSNNNPNSDLSRVSFEGLLSELLYDVLDGSSLGLWHLHEDEQPEDVVQTHEHQERVVSQHMLNTTNTSLNFHFET